MQKQIENQFSVSNKLIENFSNNLKDIQYNELMLKSEIIILNQRLVNVMQQQGILFAKNILNQLIIVYNSL